MDMDTNADSWPEVKVEQSMIVDADADFWPQSAARNGDGGSGGDEGKVRTRPTVVFPGKDEVQARLDCGECVTRQRQGASSEVWTLFQEVVYSNNFDFTGYVQCTECKWLLRFHGQLTGTSHMRRHKCFMNIHPEIREKYYGGGKNKLSDTSSPQQQAAPEIVIYESEETGGDNNSFVQLVDAETNQLLTYYGCTKCASFLKKSEANPNSHQCKQSDLSRNISISGKVLFRQKPQGRAWKQSALWEFFDEVIDAVTNATLIYVRCRRCKQMIRSVDVKGVPSVFRKHEGVCPKKGKAPHISHVKLDTPKPPVQRSSIKLADSCLQFCAAELLDPSILTRKPFTALVRSLAAHASKVRGRMSRFPNESVIQIALAEQTQSIIDQKKELVNSIASDFGGALIYNQRSNLHLLVLAYVDEKWSPVQTVIDAQFDVANPDQFIQDSLKNFDLQPEKMSNLVLVSKEKVDWVHHVLPSSAHEIDEIVESTLASHDLVHRLHETCCAVLKWHNMTVNFDTDISWIRQLMVFKEVFENESKLNFDQIAVDISLVKLLVTILSPFKEASSELRSCIERSTCNLVFLWYHKLIKILSNFSNSQISDLVNSLREAVQTKLTVGSVHKCATFLWPNFRCLKMLPIASRNDVHQEVRSFLNSSGGENQPIVSKRAKSDFSDWEDVSGEGQDEVDSYIGAVLPSCDDDHLLSWWSEHSSDFPRLSKLARKILAIPASVLDMPTKNLLAKKRQKGKFTSIVKVKALHSSWDAKMKLKKQVKSAREEEAERKAARAAELEARRLRREENLKRRQENIRKAEVVQKIKASTLKKMKKKQLKMVRKV